MKIQYLNATLIISLFLFIACNQKEKKETFVKEQAKLESDLVMAEGFQLLENNCFSCHSPSANMENRVAPPMIAVKKHYIDDDTSQEEFTQSLMAFLNNPTEENTKMPGAIEKFGVMPKMNFSDKDIAKIAAYIYNTELEKPGWFDKHYQEEKRKHSLVKTSEKTPLEIGKNLAMKTKGMLGKNLLNAIKTKGTEHALSFCSTRAINLTDSMSVELNAKIKRVSDKNRNPNNYANEDELAYIKASKEALLNGDKVKPMIKTVGNEHVGYYPIYTNKMCMQCHGQPDSEITPNVLNKIIELYPEDKAIAYGTDELRGIWVVEFVSK